MFKELEKKKLVSGRRKNTEQRHLREDGEPGLFWEHRYIQALLRNVAIHRFSEIHSHSAVTNTRATSLLAISSCHLLPATPSISVPFPPASTFKEQPASALSVFQVSPAVAFPSSSPGNKSNAKYFFFSPV